MSETEFYGWFIGAMSTVLLTVGGPLLLIQIFTRSAR